MAQRSTAPRDPKIIHRTLHWFWLVTKKKPFVAFMAVFTSVAYTALLNYANTYVMSLIVDRISAEAVPAAQVFAVFTPYVIALLLVNAIGQTCSKLQDWSVMQLEMNGNYHLARLCFDTLSNQSMTFHTSRFGGSLVSQTSRFMGGYVGLVDVVVYSLIPTLASIVCTIVLLWPASPLFVCILFVMLTVYVVVAYTMYQRILPLSAATSAAQSKLSGVLSDAVTNILAVKTCGREDYERGLFDEADREAMAAERVSMNAMMRRGAMTSTLITFIMFVTSIFVVGGNAWYGISAGTLVMMFTYTYNLSMRFNYINSMMARMNRAVGDAAEMTKVLDEPRLVEDAPGAPELVVTEGAVDFEHLAFRYEDAAEGDYVFSDLTLHVPAGQRVGLVGRSCPGKTTLTKLLLRLSDVQEGHIYVDGQDISACSQQSLRRQIAYVPQEALLFHRATAEALAGLFELGSCPGRMDAVIGERRQLQEIDLGTWKLAVRFADTPGAIVALPVAEDEAYVLLMGGAMVQPQSTTDELPFCDLLLCEEGAVADGAWVRDRRLNGDETTVIAADDPTLLRMRVLCYA